MPFIQTDTRSYIEQTSTPLSAIDWQLALKDPLTKIGRLFRTLILKIIVRKEEWLQFEEELACLDVQQRKQLEAALLFENEQAFEAEQARIEALQAAVEKARYVVPDKTADDPTLAKILAELLMHITKLAQLAMNFAKLRIQQKQLNAAWEQVHQKDAEQWVNELLRHKALSHEEKRVLLEKRAQFVQALVPPPIDRLCRIHPALTERDQSVTLENVVRANDIVREIHFHAQLTIGVPLMGPALLQAIKARRDMHAPSPGWTQANQVEARAETLKMGIALFNNMQEMQAIMQVTANTVQQHLEALSMRPSMRARMRRIDEEETHKSMQPKTPKLRIRTPVEVY